MKCSRCGEEYDPDDICITFADINKVPVDMCEDCLEEAYEDGEEGLFFDTCCKCGKTYDVVEEDSEFEDFASVDAERCDYGDGTYCAECALEAMKEEQEEMDEMLDENDDDDEDEEEKEEY